MERLLRITLFMVLSVVTLSIHSQNRNAIFPGGQKALAHFKDMRVDNIDIYRVCYRIVVVLRIDQQGRPSISKFIKVVDKKEEIPNAKTMLFVLSDGEQNRGYSLDRIAPIVGGLKIPIYSIGYNITENSKEAKELTRLSNINEAAMINANSEDLINQLRNLFNTQL